VNHCSGIEIGSELEEDGDHLSESSGAGAVKGSRSFLTEGHEHWTSSPSLPPPPLFLPYFFD
jgi:hypothetical protein